MAANPKHPPGPLMDLANMREQGVLGPLMTVATISASRHRAIAVHRDPFHMPFIRGSLLC
jgi:hypothetical protein